MWFAFSNSYCAICLANVSMCACQMGYWIAIRSSDYWNFYEPIYHRLTLDLLYSLKCRGKKPANCVIANGAAKKTKVFNFHLTFNDLLSWLAVNAPSDAEIAAKPTNRNFETIIILTWTSQISFWHCTLFDIEWHSFGSCSIVCNECCVSFHCAFEVTFNPIQLINVNVSK